MSKGLSLELLVSRTVVVVAVGFLVAYVGGDIREQPVAMGLVGLLAILYLAGTLWTVVTDSSTAFHVCLTICDWLCVTGLFCLLLPAFSNVLDTRIPFLAALLIASSISLVGGRLVAGALGSLSAAMVLVLSWALLPVSRDSMQGELFAVQVAAITGLAFQIVFVGRHLIGHRAELDLAQRVAQQLRAREREAAHVVALRERLFACAQVDDVVTTLVDHLCQNFSARAAGAVLLAENKDAGCWSERAQFGGTTTDDRRATMAELLTREGIPFDVQALDCKEIPGARTLAVRKLRTRISVPVQLDGRTDGLIVLADGRRDALGADDIAALSQVAQAVSESLGRMRRASGKQKRQMALLLQEMPEGVLLLGRRGEVLMANPVARRALQASALARQATDKPALGDVELDELACAPEGSERRFRAWVPRAGAAKPAQLSCTASVISDGNEHVGTLVTIVDVTDEIEARQRLMDAERKTVVGQTLAGVAHELNNPLAVLMGYADILGKSDVPANIDVPISRMREQALRATRIVRNLLNFARRQKSATVAHIGLTKLIEDTMELLRYEARACNVRMNITLPENLPPIRGEKYALQQILVNLVQNALQAMKETTPPTGGHRLDVDVSHDEETVSVQVRDTGPGVPRNNRETIFEAFFTTKGARNGTGLGLALSRSIAREHEGDLVLLDSKTGRGSTFLLTVPVSTDSIEVIESSDAREVRTDLALKVLVVDDEAAVREALHAQLRSMGASVSIAAASEEALKRIEQEQFDVVLTDVRMPNGSGLDLHRRIAKSHAELASRVVFMTGDFANEDLLADIETRGNRLLEKPFTSDELSSTLRAVAQSASAS